MKVSKLEKAKKIYDQILKVQKSINVLESNLDRVIREEKVLFFDLRSQKDQASDGTRMSTLLKWPHDSTHYLNSTHFIQFEDNEGEEWKKPKEEEADKPISIEGKSNNYLESAEVLHLLIKQEKRQRNHLAAELKSMGVELS